MDPQNTANMQQPGDDLLQYLIVPEPADNMSSPPEDREIEYWRYRGRFAQEADAAQQALKDTTASTKSAQNDPGDMMEVDTHAAPLPMDASSGALSLDDYLNAHPPPAPKTASKPPSQPRAANSSPKPTPIPPAPRAVGARSSKHTIKLHEKYQALAIPQPKFIFEGGSVEGWWGKVVFPSILKANRSSEDDENLTLSPQVTLHDNGDISLYDKTSCPSKQEVKEKLSEGALTILEELENKNKIGKKPKQKKGSSSSSGTAGASGGQEAHNALYKEKDTTNYVGQLLEFQRSISAPQPTYTDYQVGSGFACLATIEGHDKPFGTLEPPFHSSKKAARQYAARYAVEHFQAAGLWPETFTDAGGIKKKKKLNPPATATDANGKDAGGDNDDQIDITPTSPSLTTTTIQGEPSYSYRVAQLATTLGLPTPQWDISSPPSAPGFYTTSCTFKNSAHAGPIGEVRHILGKKKSKEECARLTLEYLLGIKEQRMKFGRKMMAGVAGGEEVERVALNRPVGGDAGVEVDVLKGLGASGAGKGKGVDRGRGGFGMDGANDEDEDAAVAGGMSSGAEDSEMDFEDAVERLV